MNSIDFCMRKILHFFQSDKMVPDKQAVAFYFRVRQRLLSVVVVEFVESELVSVGYFDLFLSKNIQWKAVFSRD